MTREAEAEEDVLELAPRLREQVQAPDGLRRLAGQRDVDAVGGEAHVELRRLRARAARCSISASSAWRAWLAALPTAPRSLGRQLGDAAQQVAAARPCARGSARAAPRARRLVVAAAIAASPSAPQAVDPLDHARRGPWTVDGSSRRARRWRPSRRSATPRRSGCGRPRRRPRATSSGRPVALGADQQRARAAARAARSPPRARPERDPRRRAARRRDRTRATGTEKIAPIEARTALGENGSAQPGPSATLAAPKASAPRRTVPTLPGSRTPHRPTHSGPAGARPALLVDAQRARARAERRDAACSSALTSTSTPASQPPRRPAPSRRRRAAASRSSPSATKRRAALALQAADLFELVVVAGW